jgi:hypothetical protein
MKVYNTVFYCLIATQPANDSSFSQRKQPKTQRKISAESRNKKVVPIIYVKNLKTITN